jgi:hypothetical protein
MMDVGGLADILSALFAGGSVVFAVQTYKNSRFTDSVAEFRKILEAAVLQSARLKELITERSINQMGVNFSHEMRDAFGDSITCDELLALLSDKRNKNILIRSYHEAFRKTFVADAVEQAQDLFAEGASTIRRFSPAFALFFQTLTKSLTDLVKSTYSPKTLTLGLLGDKVIEQSFTDIKDCKSIDIAFAEVGETLAGVIGGISQEWSGANFEIMHDLFEIVTLRMLRLSDRELRTLFRTDSSTEDATLRSQLKAAKRLDAIKLLYSTTSQWLSPDERDKISVNIGMLEATPLRPRRTRTTKAIDARRSARSRCLLLRNELLNGGSPRGLADVARMSVGG